MNLFEIFNFEPNPEYVLETEAGSGIYHIPIRFVKLMAWQDFDKWGTSNFKCRITQIGHDTVVSGSVQLDLDYLHKQLGEIPQKYHFTFIGANSFNIKNFNNDMNRRNDDYEATCLALCICNAFKNVGRKYGYFLNQEIYDALPIQQEKKITKSQVVKSINNIIKQTKI